MSQLEILAQTKDHHYAYLKKKHRAYNKSVDRTLAALSRMNEPPIAPDKSVWHVLCQHGLYNGKKSWLDVDTWIEEEAKKMQSRVYDVLEFLQIKQEDDSDEWLDKDLNLNRLVEELFLKHIAAPPELDWLCREMKKELDKQKPTANYEEDLKFFTAQTRKLVALLNKCPELDRIPYHESKRKK